MLFSFRTLHFNFIFCNTLYVFPPDLNQPYTNSSKDGSIYACSFCRRGLQGLPKPDWLKNVPTLPHIFNGGRSYRLRQP